MANFTPPNFVPHVEYTPVERHGDIWLKRDDLFNIAGVYGGKARTCFELARYAEKGLTTAGSRSSPQVNIVANIAKHLGIPCVAHTPKGELNEELILAQAAGCKIIQHKAGYNSVIVARSKAYAKDTGYTDIPFGMECHTAVAATSIQTWNIPEGVQRIVVPVGSGMSLCGIMAGLYRNNLHIPILGVMVGADPTKRIERYKPFMYTAYTLINAGVDYHTYVNASVGPVLLDPVYEAKCAKFLQPGDLLWCVGMRQSYLNKQNGI